MIGGPPSHCGGRPTYRPIVSGPRQTARHDSFDPDRHHRSAARELGRRYVLPDDLARGGWTSDNPSMGHCDITALVVHDFFGGELMVGEVHLDGDQQGHHWWNRFPSGIEVDLTREQFRLGQVVAEGRAVQRPQAGRLRAGMSTSCCVTGTGAGSADIPAGDRGALTRRRL